MKDKYNVPQMLIVLTISAIASIQNITEKLLEMCFFLSYWNKCYQSCEPLYGM